MEHAHADVYFGKVLRYAARGIRLASRIGALTIQPNQKVLPSQLRSRQTDQQLTAGVPAIAGLDWIDRRVQQPDHAKPVNQLAHAAIPDTDRHLDYPGEAVILVTNTKKGEFLSAQTAANQGPARYPRRRRTLHQPRPEISEKLPPNASA
jgi:hypothetical protein